MLVKRTNFRFLFLRWWASGIWRHIVWYKLTDISEVLTASVITILVMELISTSETSVIYKQRGAISQKAFHLHTCSFENLRFLLYVRFVLPLAMGCSHASIVSRI
jgi:hypothetical protein